MDGALQHASVRNVAGVQEPSFQREGVDEGGRGVGGVRDQG